MAHDPMWSQVGPGYKWTVDQVLAHNRPTRSMDLPTGHFQMYNWNRHSWKMMQPPHWILGLWNKSSLIVEKVR